MAEFCQTFKISPSEYKALTMDEYIAFIKVLQKEVEAHEFSSKR
jgi:hypothetical protein